MLVGVVCNFCCYYSLLNHFVFTKLMSVKCDMALANQAMEIDTHSDFLNTNNSDDY